MNYISWANKLTGMNVKNVKYIRITRQLFQWNDYTFDSVWNEFPVVLRHFYFALFWMDATLTSSLSTSPLSLMSSILLLQWSFQIYGNQQDRRIHLFSMASSTINCSFPSSVGLMTLTLRRGMGLRALTEVSNWYCPLIVFTTVLLQTMTASTSVDGRENMQKMKMFKIRKEMEYFYRVCTNTPTAREERQHPNTKMKGKKTHKQIFTQTHDCMYTKGTETGLCGCTQNPFYLSLH